MGSERTPDGNRETTPPAITRRGFVRAVSASAAVFIGIGAAGTLTREGTLLRPPGAQDETILLARCNRCGRCVSACHTEAIGVASVTRGVASVRTPVMRFDIGHCDFCGDCVDVCPTSAIRRFDAEAAQAGDPSAARIGVAEISASICLAWTSNSCNLCYTECPYGAVEVDGRNLPRIVQDKCNGCGVCENICPVLSLRSYIGGSDKAVAVKPANGASYRGEGERE